MRFTTLCSIAFFSVATLGMASTAFADTEVFDWADDKRPVLIENDSGLIFISDEKEPDRVYEWSNKNAGADYDSVYLADLGDEDGYEIVGSGTPMFVLQTNGDPLWSLDGGCDQTVLAHFMGRESDLEVLCQTDRELKLYTNDGQKVWSMSLGAPIDECRVGDYDGNSENDVECKYRGRQQWIRIDSEGEILAKSVESPELPEERPSVDQAEPVSSDILKGEQTFDLDGDGNDDERLKTDGSTLIIDSKAQEDPIAKVDLDGEPVGALVKNLDGDEDNRLEIVAVTDDSIYVISHDGEDKETFSASAGDYERVPHASLRSVYANNFEDDAKAKKTVEDLQDDLSECYAGKVSQDKFTNTGRLMLQVQVDDKGGVSNISRTHSDFKDQQVQQCAERALRGGDYPAAKEGTGTINVKMKYTFRDE